MTDKKKRRDVPSSISLIAGAVAGGVEAAATYPTEFVKTQLQLSSSSKITGSALKFSGPIDVLVKTVKQKGFFALYKGVDAAVIGASVKAATRFFAFENSKKLLTDKNGDLSGMRRVLAGGVAGFIEAVVAVTPSECIKTKLIHDQNSPTPKYRNLIHGTKTIIKTEGISGLYRGVTAVVLRQSANSAVRLSSFDLLKDFTSKKLQISTLPWYLNFLNGAIAGIITVYATMPLDVVKTKMQSLDAKSRYKNSVHCLYRVVKDDGFFALWKGATPRLGRLIFSGGIIFTVYEAILDVYDSNKRKD